MINNKSTTKTRIYNEGTWRRPWDATWLEEEILRVATKVNAKLVLLSFQFTCN